MPQRSESDEEAATVVAAKADASSPAPNGGITEAEAVDRDVDAVVMEKDEWGLPVRKRAVVQREEEESSEGRDEVNGHAVEGKSAVQGNSNGRAGSEEESEGEDEFKDAPSTPDSRIPLPQTPLELLGREAEISKPEDTVKEPEFPQTRENGQEIEGLQHKESEEASKALEDDSKLSETEHAVPKIDKQDTQVAGPIERGSPHPKSPNQHTRGQSSTGGGISEWSHQHITQKKEEVKEDEEDGWQPMPAFAPYDMYDDDNRLIAREAHDFDHDADNDVLGGAGKGYTRVQLDEDAQSATSLDENTQYLFKDVNAGTGAGEMEDEQQRDAVSQMQATKDLLTEGQRIAYVGMTRLILAMMIDQAESIVDPASKSSKKEVQLCAESIKMWSQRMMARLYAHMEISTAEQIMIEQLSEHGVVPSDLTPTLMQNARVKNPMADEKATSIAGLSSPRPSSMASTDRSPRPSISTPKAPVTHDEEESAAPPPPYQEHEGEDLPEVRTPFQLPTTANIDIDLRWTVLCDLFLTLIADSVYDARSRVLLEKVGENMQVDWLEICRFEKRVTEALEMQQAAEKENWNEDEHKETRRKMALKKRYIMMGLATVGGGLVIGLSAGLLAPVIGAGLAAGFTTIGVAGTSGFLAGAGGAAIITSSAAASGGIIAVRAANRRTGAVKTFEYRPLHNNKRVNLIVTVSGWMTGKVDDVRLPYSTVDPIMGDIYSVLWEPEMLTSMGDTINILATEVSLLKRL